MNWLYNDIYRIAFNELYHEDVQEVKSDKDKFINITNYEKCEWQEHFIEYSICIDTPV